MMYIWLYVPPTRLPLQTQYIRGPKFQSAVVVTAPTQNGAPVGGETHTRHCTPMAHKRRNGVNVSKNKYNKYHINQSSRWPTKDVDVSKNYIIKIINHINQYSKLCKWYKPFIYLHPDGPRRCVEVRRWLHAIAALYDRHRRRRHGDRRGWEIGR